MGLLKRKRQLTRSNQRRRRSFPIRYQDGRFRFTNPGAWYTYWRDPYHLLLTIPWWGFVGLIAAGYIGVNALFALAYLAGGDSIENAEPGSFRDAFFFSVQTLASIGYGVMHPRTTYADILVTLEALLGIVGVAIATGLAFARFARPTARVLFSRVAVVMPYNGVPTLMFRTANQRSNQIIEAEMRLYLLRDEVSLEGEFMRRFYELKLLRTRTPSFTLTWTAMHPIDETSPLYGSTPEDLANLKAQIEVSLTGLDETVSQVIHARHAYAAQDILWNWRFVDILGQTASGDRFIDFTHFHDALPLSPTQETTATDSNQ